MSLNTIYFYFGKFVGVAYRNNKLTQGKIAEEGAIPLLVQLLNVPPSEEIQVEVAMSLACIVLGNHGNQEKLQEEETFKFDLLLDLLNSRHEVGLYLLIKVNKIRK